MSSENVERLRVAYETFRATKRVDTAAMTPDVELIQPDGLGGGAGVYHGPEAFVRGIQELTDTFDDFRVEPEEFFDLGGRVLAFVRLRGRARASDVPIDAPFAHVVTFRGALISSWHAYADRKDALQALGLSDVGPASRTRL